MKCDKCDNGTLKESIHNKLTGRNAYRCDTCDSIVEVKKSFKLDKNENYYHAAFPN